MKLSRTACDAVHAMVYIARHDDDGHPVAGHVAVKELAIPTGVLSSISRAGLLRSMKGPSGGYNLARAAKAISLLDIIEAVEGPIRAIADPISSPPGALDKKLQAVVDAATETMRKELGRVTLADLMTGGKKGR